MDRRHFRLLLVLATSALLGFASFALGQAQDVPFTGVIVENNVSVRAGAGRAYYIVGQLKRGDIVEVEELIFGWHRIGSPRNVCSYISKAFLDSAGDGRSGTVNAERADVKAGSVNGPGESYRVQLVLKKGQEVKVLGEIGSFYKIMPPPGASVFIPPGSVQRASREQIAEHMATDSQEPAQQREAPSPVAATPPTLSMDRFELGTSEALPSGQADALPATLASESDVLEQMTELFAVLAEPTPIPVTVPSETVDLELAEQMQRAATAAAVVPATEPVFESAETLVPIAPETIDLPKQASGELLESVRKVPTAIAKGIGDRLEPLAGSTATVFADAAARTSAIAQDESSVVFIERPQLQTAGQTQLTTNGPTKVPIKVPTNVQSSQTAARQVLDIAPDAPAVMAKAGGSTLKADTALTLEGLEHRYGSVFKLPLEQQDLPAMIAAYEKLAGSALTATDRIRVSQRLAALKHNAKIKLAIAAVASAQAATQVRPVAWPPPTPDAPSDVTYDAVGHLMVSSVYNGTTLPRMFRLVNAARTATIAYVEPDAINDSAMLGRVVGIVGHRSYDPATKLNVIAVRKIDVLSRTPDL